MRFTCIKGSDNNIAALDVVRTNFLAPKHGAERNVSKYVIVLTDGQSLEPALTQTAAARLKVTQTLFHPKTHCPYRCMLSQTVIPRTIRSHDDLLYVC